MTPPPEQNVVGFSAFIDEFGVLLSVTLKDGEIDEQPDVFVDRTE